jgi:hypothetical protein
MFSILEIVFACNYCFGRNLLKHYVTEAGLFPPSGDKTCTDWPIHEAALKVWTESQIVGFRNVLYHRQKEKLHYIS